MDLEHSIYLLVKKCSTDLPADVESALRKGLERETNGSAAESALKTILENVELSRKQGMPICQDTGTPVFHVRHPVGYSTLRVIEAVNQAVKKATTETILRQNAVDPVTGINTGNNIGNGFPQVYFVEENRDDLQIGLILKGGGSENCGVQYRLPDTVLGAGRDLEGVKKCVLHAAYAAQGKGCAPGIIGVCIGGDRASSFTASKHLLFKKLHERNSDPILAGLEEELYTKLNMLGIGPMGFGGNTTILGIKITKLHRVPASFFVSVTYMCWAYRRYSMVYQEGEFKID